MRWYTGSIVEAVKLSKSKNAYFVVYIEGPDERSKEMSNVLERPDITSRLEDDTKFVIIKVKSDTEAYTQFAQIYKLVPIPSVFFIGDNGAPVEIVIGDKDDLGASLVLTIDKLVEKKGGLNKTNASSSTSVNKTASSSFLSAEQASSSSAPAPVSTPAPAASNSVETPKNEEKSNDDSGYKVVCEGDVCTRVKIEPPKDAEKETKETSESEESSSQSTDLRTPEMIHEEKLKKVKELLEKKRIADMEEERKKERQKELDRREQGHGLAELKKWQQEQELKNLKEERLKEKKENDEARARVLQQIAQDKAERQGRFTPSAVETTKSSPVSERTPSRPVDNNITRIQFKMADGTSHTTQFSSDSLFAELRQYVRDVIQISGPFTLSTVYPRRCLGEEQDSETLRSLELAPSSALLLLRGGAATSSPGRSPAPVANNDGFFGMMTQLFWSLIVSPVQGFWAWISGFISGDRNRTPGPSGSTSYSQPGAARGTKNTSPNNESEAKRRRVGPSQLGGGTTSIRREGNTYRLKDNDSDDENNTWNGNSTQQM